MGGRVGVILATLQHALSQTHASQPDEARQVHAALAGGGAGRQHIRAHDDDQGQEESDIPEPITSIEQPLDSNRYDDDDIELV